MVRKIDGTWWPDINKGLLYLFNEKGIYKQELLPTYVNLSLISFLTNDLENDRNIQFLKNSLKTVLPLKIQNVMKNTLYNWDIVESGIKHHKPNQTNINICYLWSF
jgi:fumarate reductase subunit C